MTDSLWIVDTPRGGFHVWARCAGLEIEKGKFDRPALGLDGGYHIELRWTGHYAALPESHHPNGVYQWHGDEPTAPPPAVDRDALLTAYAAVTKEPEVKPAPASVHTNGNTPHVPGQGYAAKALSEELQGLRSAPSNRNDALNAAAFSLGQLVGAGLLSEGEVEQALLDTATDIGLGEGESVATIRSGLRSGIAKPRVVPLNGNGYNGSSGEIYAYGYAADLPDAADLDELPEPKPAKHNTWPYTVKDGRICLVRGDYGAARNAQDEALRQPVQAGRRPR